MGEILKELPAVILRGSVLLPGVVSHLISVPGNPFMQWKRQ